MTCSRLNNMPTVKLEPADPQSQFEQPVLLPSTDSVTVASFAIMIK